MNRVYTLGAVLAIALTAIVMLGGEKSASAGLFNRHCGGCAAPAHCGCGGLLARLHARHCHCDAPPACHCGGLLSRIRARLAALHCCGCQEAPVCAPACEPACAPACPAPACEPACPAPCDTGCCK